MKLFSATSRIVLSMSALCVTILLTAHLLGLVPNERDPVMIGRSRLCESIAIHFSLLAQEGNVPAMNASLHAIRARNKEIVSIGVRRVTGEILLQVGDHANHWSLVGDQISNEEQMYVPIADGAKRWGTVEVVFQPISTPGVMGWLTHPFVILCGFMTIASAVSFYLYLGRVLQQLNPKKVVPPRVKNALDTLAEGLLITDKSGRIVLANESFATTTGKSFEELLGRQAEDLPWRDCHEDVEDLPGSSSGVDRGVPWAQVLLDGQPRRGRLMGLDDIHSRERTFVVNATPICDDKGGRRGVITSFEDVTKLQQKKVELSEMLASLRQSSDKIRQQNQELERLATLDPLTGCYNRRFLFERFDGIWSDVSRGRLNVAVAMVDVDHFKAINDKYGHGVGDMVLQQVGECLQNNVRDDDIVGRYGGEEFAIVMPHATIEQANQTAERMRRALQEIRFEQGLSITASVGVSGANLHARSPQELIEQADKCLYVAKRNGRNQVVRFDEVPEDLEIDESKLKRSSESQTSQIPFPAVTALISALAYRDPETAAHSRRVADLCVAVGQGLMSMGSCYVLETAALLHDIGKIGVPDSILLKPDALTPAEWEVMRRHDRIGLEILRASFGSQDLSEIVENYRCHQQEAERKNFVLPLGARILAIADAFDSMVTERSYREARTFNQAFEELRRCGGTQFDSELVERFIAAVAIQSRQKRVQPQLSKESALGIGLELERLAMAVDQQDLASLKVMAGRLAATAAKAGAPELSGKALELEQQVEQGEDLLSILRSANELLNFCRATQASYLVDQLGDDQTSEIAADEIVVELQASP
ncbi:MAG: diguanylate cyclase [Planctomycetaceae bacterium]|nr:diguanylate cyclase [Planctomycetaceae bacterium]